MKMSSTRLGQPLPQTLLMRFARATQQGNYEKAKIYVEHAHFDAAAKMPIIMGLPFRQLNALGILAKSQQGDGKSILGRMRNGFNMLGLSRSRKMTGPEVCDLYDLIWAKPEFDPRTALEIVREQKNVFLIRLVESRQSKSLNPTAAATRTPAATPPPMGM
jgi:hypothetical protein